MHVLAIVERRLVDVVLGLSLAVPREALGDPRVRHARHHHGNAGSSARDQGLDRDHAAPDRRVRRRTGLGRIAGSRTEKNFPAWTNSSSVQARGTSS
jgi:hypothetical protein